MRIFFISGSLEPGKSGVGDYTYLLAAAVARLGHECELISLNDAWVEKADTKTREVAGVGLCVTRCPGDQSWEQAEARLQSLLRERNPDWVCLQFVTYAYAHRGMVWPKLRNLASILRPWKTELMFHELWIGEFSGAPLRERLIGFIQRVMIQHFLRSLRPARMHTSIPLYQQVLRESGIDVDLMPMFGTIQASESAAEGWIFPLLASAGIPLTPQNRSDYLTASFFGSIYPGAPFREALDALNCEARRQRKTLVLFSIGEPGPGASIWEELAEEYSGRVHFLRLGRQPEARISELLLFLDLGLSTTPLDIIGKSSSVAVMLEHGLPVMVLNEGQSKRPVPGAIPEGVFYWQCLLSGKFEIPVRHPIRSGLNDAAELLIASLNPSDAARSLEPFPATP